MNKNEVEIQIKEFRFTISNFKILSLKSKILQTIKNMTEIPILQNFKALS